MAGIVIDAGRPGLHCLQIPCRTCVQWPRASKQDSLLAVAAAGVERCKRKEKDGGYRLTCQLEEERGLLRGGKGQAEKCWTVTGCRAVLLFAWLD